MREKYNGRNKKYFTFPYQFSDYIHTYVLLAYMHTYVPHNHRDVDEREYF
jgi:hypothetical protein